MEQKEADVLFVDDDGHGWTQKELDQAEVEADIAGERSLENYLADAEV